MVRVQFPTNFKYKNNFLRLSKFKEPFPKIFINSVVVTDRTTVSESLLLAEDIKYTMVIFFYNEPILMSS